MRVKITKAFDLHINTNEKGRPLATVAFTPSDEPITVKREWGEALIAAKAGVEVKEAAKRPENSPATMKALRSAVGTDDAEN